MNRDIEQRVDSLVEELRQNIIQNGKKNGLEWANSEKLTVSVVESQLYLFGGQIIEMIMNKFEISREQATSLFGKAKAKIYDKYSE